jgi:TPP-dependent 2-oxoacid decarboxylase
LQDKFIYIQDKEEADKLIKAGYHLIDSNNGFYIFENNKEINFNLDSKYVLSNTLFF